MQVCYTQRLMRGVAYQKNQVRTKGKVLQTVYAIKLYTKTKYSYTL